MGKKRNLILVAALLVAFGTGVVAKDVFEVIKAEIRTDFTVKIDGEVRKFENVEGERVYPILHDGTTYLPLRAIAEIMGKEVYWYEDDKLIEIKDKEKNGPTVTDADVIVDDEKPAKQDKEDAGYIGKEKAKEIALEKAGLKESDVVRLKVELEKDNGIFVYEVEFEQGNKEYKAEIKADDGKILDWEIDIDD